MPTLPSAVVGGLADDNFWSSSQNDNNANNAWNQNFNNGNQNNNNKDNNNRVRPVRGFRRDRIVRAESGLGRKRLSGSARLASRGLGNQQLELFGIRPPLPGPLGHIDVAEVFEAYRECRRNKRSTRAALEFELDQERNLISPWREINSGTYQPQQAIAFVVQRPVQREVFAATFRDRVVHHLLIRKIGSIIERDLLDDVYACRAGKGTLYGIRRLEQAIRTCSKNYREPCFVLRLDISGFFMSIDTGILLDRVEALILADYSGSDRGRVIELLRTVILTRPSENCVIRGSLRDWQGLPPSKSLFHSAPGCGLPIGNLTSQVLANAYLSPLDHFIRSELQVQFYGRYVDDLVLVHPNADKLRWARSRIREYLRTELALTMHPRKVVLQSHSQGVKFLGVVLKPGRTYVGARAKGRCHQVLSEHEHNASFPPTTEQVAAMVAATNSYLGLMRHFQTYRLRRRVLMRLDRRWWAVISATQGYRSVRVRGHGDRGRG